MRAFLILSCLALAAAKPGYNYEPANQYYSSGALQQQFGGNTFASQSDLLPTLAAYTTQSQANQYAQQSLPAAYSTLATPLTSQPQTTYQPTQSVSYAAYQSYLPSATPTISYAGLTGFSALQSDYATSAPAYAQNQLQGSGFTFNNQFLLQPQQQQQQQQTFAPQATFAPAYATQQSYAQQSGFEQQQQTTYAQTNLEQQQPTYASVLANDNAGTLESFRSNEIASTQFPTEQSSVDQSAISVVPTAEAQQFQQQQQQPEQLTQSFSQQSLPEQNDFHPSLPEPAPQDAFQPMSAPQQSFQQTLPESAPQQSFQQSLPEPAPQQSFQQSLPEPAPQQSFQQSLPEPAPQLSFQQSLPEPAPQQSFPQSLPEEAHQQSFQQSLPEPAPQQSFPQSLPEPAHQQSFQQVYQPQQAYQQPQGFSQARQLEPIQTTTIHKSIYVHVPPPELEEPEYQELPLQVQPVVNHKKHYKVIFIKAPSPVINTRLIQQHIQARNEEKTLVYVLVKKPEAVHQIERHIEPEHKPTDKPEVYFIKYKAQKEQIGAYPPAAPSHPEISAPSLPGPEPTALLPPLPSTEQAPPDFNAPIVEPRQNLDAAPQPPQFPALEEKNNLQASADTFLDEVQIPATTKRPHYHNRFNIPKDSPKSGALTKSYPRKPAKEYGPAL